MGLSLMDFFLCILKVGVSALAGHIEYLHQARQSDNDIFMHF